AAPLPAQDGYPEGWYFHGGWGFVGWVGLGHGTAFGEFGPQGPPGWTPRGYYGGWGYRAPGFSANYAPFAVRPLPPAPAAPATLIINMPAGAELTVNDRPTSQTSDTRTFTASKLARNTTGYYDLKARVVRDGQTQVMTRRVALRPGEVTRVTLDVPEAAVTRR